MGMGLAMTILVVVMIVLMAGAVARGALTRVRSRIRRTSNPAQARPEQLLSERYARGEISSEEYEARHRTLTGSARPEA